MVPQTHTQLSHLTPGTGERVKRVPKYKCPFFRFASSSQKLSDRFVSISNRPKARISKLWSVKKWTPVGPFCLAGSTVKSNPIQRKGQNTLNVTPESSMKSVISGRNQCVSATSQSFCMCLVRCTHLFHWSTCVQSRPSKPQAFKWSHQSYMGSIHQVEVSPRALQSLLVKMPRKNTICFRGRFVKPGWGREVDTFKLRMLW